MPYVYSFIRSLNGEELKKIASLSLQEREREVLATLMQVKQKAFPSLSISKQLNLKASHLDKINSVLLKKSIEALAGTSIYDQILFLATKTGLWNLSKHLLKSYEQKNIKSGEDKNEIKKFYRFCFEWILTAPFSHQELHEVEYFSEHFLNHCTQEEKREKQLWVNLAYMRREINMAISKTTVRAEPVKQNIYIKLQGLITEAEKINSLQNILRAKLLAITLHNVFMEYDISLQFADEIELLIGQHQTMFSEYDQLVAKWHRAQIFFHSSQFEKSYNLYHHLAAKTGISLHARWFVFYGEYFQASLATGHLDTAKQIIESYFLHFTDDISSSFFISTLLQITKYNLYTKQYDKAKQTIDTIKKNLQKTSLMQFQIAFKELQLAHAYLTGDLKTAHHLAEQNLKFMRFKNIHRTLPEYTYHSRMVKYFIKNKNSEQPVNGNELFMLDELQKGTRSQYGKLLKRWNEGK